MSVGIGVACGFCVVAVVVLERCEKKVEKSGRRGGGCALLGGTVLELEGGTECSTVCVGAVSMVCCGREDWED